MREILFRAKRLDNGRGYLSPWIEGHYFQTPLTEESVIGAQASDGMFFLVGKKRHVIEKDGCVYEIDAETLGQFTGLTDKNGKKIFEGDILRYDCYDIGDEEWYVNTRQVEYTISKLWVLDYEMHCSLSKNFEVIGNIHDNPKLVKP